MNYDSFGQVIAKKGDRIRITNKSTKVALEGEAVYDISRDTLSVIIRLDGTSMRNVFRAKEWTVEVVVPPLKPGIYVQGVLFYRVTEHSITVTSFSVGDEVSMGQSNREAYARAAHEGRMKFIGGLA